MLNSVSRREIERILARRLGDGLFVPGSGYARRAVRRAWRLCAGGVPPVEAAKQSLLEVQRQDVALIATASEPAVVVYSRKFQWEADEVMNESLVRAVPSVAKNFVPPPSSAGPGIHFNRLRHYVWRIVQRAAWDLRYPPRRPIYLTDEALDQVDRDFDTVSESEMYDQHFTLLQKLDSWLGSAPDRRRRLQAIAHSRTLAEAAAQLGISDFALRRWLFNLRRRAWKLMGFDGHGNRI